MTVYLDYNATAPLREPAWTAMAAILRAPGNASSVHRPGRQARRLIEQARESLARHLSASPAGIIFTSGGTEANNLALRAFPGRRTLVSAIEHPSVLQNPRDATIPVDRHGIVDGEALATLLQADPRPALVSVMYANNETGVCQPIAALAGIAHHFGALFHCDAVQGLGKDEIDIQALGIDALSVSAHKIGGPQGIGALVLAEPEMALTPLLTGGGQERRHRAGTENVAAIAGFAAALDAMGDLVAEHRRLAALRDLLEARCRAALPEIAVLGGEAPRLANTSCLAFPGLSAQTLLMALDLAGFAISAGSACSSGKLSPSHVLLAMGEERLAGQAIRISLGWATQPDEVDLFTERLIAEIRRLSVAAA